MLVLRFEAETDERRDELRADVEAAVAEAPDRIVLARSPVAPIVEEPGP